MRIAAVLLVLAVLGGCRQPEPKAVRQHPNFFSGYTSASKKRAAGDVSAKPKMPAKNY